AARAAARGGALRGSRQPAGRARRAAVRRGAAAGRVAPAPRAVRRAARRRRRDAAPAAAAGRGRRRTAAHASPRRLMKFLLVATFAWPDHFGGAERVIGEVAARLVRRGHAVTLLTSRLE